MENIIVFKSSTGDVMGPWFPVSRSRSRRDVLWRLMSGSARELVRREIEGIGEKEKVSVWQRVGRVSGHSLGRTSSALRPKRLKGKRRWGNAKEKGKLDWSDNGLLQIHDAFISPFEAMGRRNGSKRTRGDQRTKLSKARDIKKSTIESSKSKCAAII